MTIPSDLELFRLSRQNIVFFQGHGYRARDEGQRAEFNRHTLQSIESARAGVVFST